jgi:pimeloyl-ACP methyl ester carboxylesterase
MALKTSELRSVAILPIRLRYRQFIPVLLAGLCFCCFNAEAFGDPGEFVVLLHGLARTKRSMAGLEKHLSASGYQVINMGYPSREKTIQELSDEILPKVVSRCRELRAKKIHFVTHSMGGILIRYYLTQHDIPSLGRVVMLSPPNNGSEVVDRLKDLSLFRWINGPAGVQLGTDEASIPRHLGRPSYEVGIITGDRSINLFLSRLIPGSDDGKVSVRNAQLEGMKDFLVVHKTHPFIMNDEKVMAQVSTFLSTGFFKHDKP